MPFAQLYIMEGRTEEQKRQLIEKMTEALFRCTSRKCMWLDTISIQNQLGYSR